jgi:hypothetical protein
MSDRDDPRSSGPRADRTLVQTGTANNRRTKWLRRPLTVAHVVVVVTAAAVILGSLGFLVASVVYDKRIERALMGQQPEQFRGQLSAQLLDDYGHVFGVAHNSGDSIGTAVRALVADADVLEIDVIAVDGRLYAGHSIPTRIFGQTEFRGPPLNEIWVVASAAEAIQIDLKASALAHLDLVFNLLAERRGGPPVVVTTPNVAALRAFAERSPETLRFYSVDSRSDIAALQGDPTLTALIDGVSIREDLVDEETMSWFTEQQLSVWAWTVNGIARVNELVALGVDGITTDNLAILEVLGGDEAGELPLTHRSPPAPSVPAENKGGNEADGGGDEDRPG